VLIVIEGVDRTGKTTLAEKLAEQLGSRARVVHAGPPSRHPVEEYETAIADYDPRSGDHLILDRWHVGEHVWPVIFGRELHGEATARHVELFMRSRGAVLVYAERANRAGLSIDLERNNEPLSASMLPTALELYERAMDWGYMAPIRYDYETACRADLTYILSYADFRARLVERVWSDVSHEWLGNDYPNYILVGDKPGPDKPRYDAPEGVPFVPFPATSGAYLMRCLPLESWHLALIVNSHNRAGEPRDLGHVVHQHGSPPVVALGWSAHRTLEEQEIPHRQVPHPQYWRRFHYHDPDTYTERLRRATARG
jgi:hypothetical protein